jgi:uncharacterized membrane protein YeaQ/YmgE (transglycosylase-associated protein family)
MEIIDRPTLPDPSSTSNRSIALRFGAIWGASSIFMSLIGFLTDTDPNMPDTGPIKWVYMIVGLGIAVWAVAAAIKLDRNQLGGYISLGRCIGLATLMSLISGVIGAVYTLLYTQIINPDFKEQMSAAMQAQWEKQGMSEQQIEAAAGMASMFTSPLVIVVTQIIVSVIFGVIIGLIAGAIMKRDRPYA